MRLPEEIRSKLNLTVGRAPKDWENLDWQEINGVWTSGKYKIYWDDRFGYVISETKTVGYEMTR